MKAIPGVIFFGVFAVLLALLTAKKTNHNTNPVATEITAATNTTDGITVIVQTNSTTASFRHE